ncbi:MAG: cytidylate kinase family protein, partial [Paludibacteraceae bacterium]|nr:cytidylate kinase family protein [Paludibacteraceae bacterium]
MAKRIIVTIGREFGTGGRRIATKLAELLGVGLYDSGLL